MFRKNPLSGASAPLLLALGLALGLGLPARATERFYAIPSLTLMETFDSNALNRETEIESEFRTHIQPGLRIRSESDRGSLEAAIALNSHFSSELSNEDGTDRTLSLAVDRRLTKRFSWTVDAAHRFLAGGDPFEDDADLQVAAGRPDFNSKDFSTGWRYLLTERNSLRFNVGMLSQAYDEEIGFGTENRRDLDSVRANLSLVRLWSEFDRTILSLAAVGNTFGETATESERDSLNLSLNATWQRTWSPRWTTALTLGIRRLNSDVADELVPINDLLDPTDDPDAFEDTTRDEVSFAFVGGFSLTRETGRTTSELSFSRSTSPRSGFGTDQNVDQLLLRHRIRLSKRANLSFGASYLRQESAGDVLIRRRSGIGIAFDPTRGIIAVPTCSHLQGFQLAQRGTQFVCAYVSDQALQADVIGLRVQLDYRWNDRLWSFTKWEYTDQRSGGDEPLPQYNEHRIVLGFRYSFELDIL